MSTADAVGLLASARIDPDEADRADVRWAMQMQAMHAFTGASRPYPALWWLQQLPWRDEYVSPEERAKREAEHERSMAEFHRAYQERKKAKDA